MGPAGAGAGVAKRASSRAPRPRPKWRPTAAAVSRNRSKRSRRPWMRRTTICRSERAAPPQGRAGLLAWGGGLAPALAAQDTTQARRDTSNAAQDTTQAPAPSVAPGQLPATHTVSKGETRSEERRV